MPNASHFTAHTTALVETDVDLAVVAAEASAMFEARAKQCGVALVLAVEEPAPCIRGTSSCLTNLTRGAMPTVLSHQ